MRSALETLKPRVRKCGQEVEGLSSENTPMEQVHDHDVCQVDLVDHHDDCQVDLVDDDDDCQVDLDDRL